MKFYILIVFLILLSACVKPIETEIKENPLQEIIKNQTVSQNLSKEEPIQITYAELQKQRKRESVKDIFDFSLLNANNCDTYYVLFERVIIDNREHKRSLELDLEDEQKSIDDSSARIKQAQAAADEQAVIEAKEDYDQALQEYDEINDQINDLEAEERDVTYILAEIKSDCIYLKKRKA